jgi:hypothetical protein
MCEYKSRDFGKFLCLLLKHNPLKMDKKYFFFVFYSINGFYYLLFYAVSMGRNFIESKYNTDTAKMHENVIVSTTLSVNGSMNP